MSITVRIIPFSFNKEVNNVTSRPFPRSTRADPEELVYVLYGSAFGWAFQKWDGPMDYWIIRTGSADERGIDGGLIRRQGDAPVA